MEATIKIKKADNGYKYLFKYKEGSEGKIHDMVFTNAEHLAAAIKQHVAMYFPANG